MGIIIKDRNPLISFILTDYGKKQMSLGKLSFDYYAFGDSDIDYKTADINSSILKPTTSIEDLKYLLYKKDKKSFYQLTDDKIESEEIINHKSCVYKLFNYDNNIITIDERFIQITGDIINTESPYIIEVKFDKKIEKEQIKPLDFITIYLNNEFKYLENTSFDIHHCQIENILHGENTTKIYLKQPLNENLKDFRFFITSSDFLFFDNMSWNQIYCGNQLLSNEPRFDGIRQYFETKDGVLIYHNDQINQNDFNEISTNYAELVIPTIMWDKSPTNKMGIKLHTDNTFNDLVSPVNEHCIIKRVGLNDDYNNHIGYYLPQHKMFYIDDIEIATTIANKNGRNWTLPSIDYEYIPSNGNGIFNKTDDDLYVTYRLKGGIHNNTSYCRKLLFIPNRKGDYQINLDFNDFRLPSLVDPSRKIKEISILYQFVPSGGEVKLNKWNEITMLKGDSLTLDNIRGKYGFNNQHLSRGNAYENLKINNLDEQLFLGNVQYQVITKKYKTTFNFVTDPNRSIYTSNPTYTNDKDIRVSEVIVYDKKYKPVAYAKVSHSIRWRTDITFTIKTQIIF